MATTTLDQRLKYVPNRTLGRSGYAPGLEDRLHMRANQLDALLCVLTCDPEVDEGFQACNDTIQRTVLELASSLAREINELQEEILLARARGMPEGATATA